MINLQMPDEVYSKHGSLVSFNQLALKVAMDSVSNEQYFCWLDRMVASIGQAVPGAKIVEKPTARENPPLDTAVYYDTGDYRVLPTGALLRTSCNRITHAFCAFKKGQDAHGVRNDHRYVFTGDEKVTIQTAPASEAAVAIVQRLLARSDIEHPGTYLERFYNISPETLEPTICLADHRYTFFAWLDGKDALRCSIDRYTVWDLRLSEDQQERRDLSEVELAVYPRVDPIIAQDHRVTDLINVLSESLCREFAVSVTRDIKYQRAAKALGLWKDQ